MKRLTIITLTLILSIGLIGGPTCAAFAGTSISSLVNSYKKALAAENSAKAVYDAAAVDYNKGSLGFFNWVASTKSGWMRDDAVEAIQVLNKTSFKKYTKIGAANDATGLDNMKKAISFLPELAKLRAGDPNFKGLQAPTVRSVYMARAQVNANASAFTIRHMPSDDGFPTGETSECLAWGYSNPFDGWYREEKANYDKMRKHFLNKYHVDINDADAEDVLEDRIGWDAYEAECAQFGEVGHYYNVCSGQYVLSNLVIFGIAFSKNGEWGGTYCLNNDEFDRYDAAYSVSEYTNLFNSYYKQVYPAAEAKAYNSAKATKNSVLSKLKSAAKPAKPTAKRSKKKVKVKWKKKSGVTGYQISVSPSRGKTKIVATVSGKTAKKTVKISKAKKQYVKVRSYIKVSGTTVYSNWSAVRKTK